MNKVHLCVLTILTALLMIMSATYVNAAAPTTGSIDAPSKVQVGIQFSIKLTNLATTAGSNYYVVYVDGATYGLANVTLVATSNTQYVTMKFTSAGSNTISLGGTTTIGGAAASAISSVYVISETVGAGIVDVSTFTSLLPFLIPITIVVGIVMIFKWKSSGKP